MFSCGVFFFNVPISLSLFLVCATFLLLASGCTFSNYIKNAGEREHAAQATTQGVGDARLCLVEEVREVLLVAANE